jgi:hypothetical protein
MRRLVVANVVPMYAWKEEMAREANALGNRASVQPLNVKQGTTFY